MALAQAAYSAPAEKVTMYFFWGQGCPHCAAMEPFIEKMQGKYKNLQVKSLEVFNNKDNLLLLNDMAAAYSKNATVVPDVFISDQMIMGYNGPKTENQTETMILACSQKKCASPDDILAAYRSKPPATTSTAPPGTTTTTSTALTTTTTPTTTSPATTTTRPIRQQVANGSITMYFFYGDGCPHCAQMEPFIQKVIKTYPQMNVKSLEVFNNESNARFFDTLAKAYGKIAQGVPTTFIGDQMIEGYITKDNETETGITNATNNCTIYGCLSPDQKYEAYVKEHPTTTTIVTSTTRPVQETTITAQPTGKGAGDDGTILIILVVVIVLIVVLALLLRKGGSKADDGSVKKGEAE